MFIKLNENSLTLTKIHSLLSPYTQYTHVHTLHKHTLNKKDTPSGLGSGLGSICPVNNPRLLTVLKRADRSILFFFFL